MIKTLGIIARVKIYSVVHLFVALEDAKLAFCVLEKVSEGLWPVFKGFVKCVMVIRIPVIQQNCGRVQKTKKKTLGAFSVGKNSVSVKTRRSGKCTEFRIFFRTLEPEVGGHMSLLVFKCLNGQPRITFNAT